MASGNNSTSANATAAAGPNGERRIWPQMGRGWLNDALGRNRGVPGTNSVPPSIPPAPASFVGRGRATPTQARPMSQQGQQGQQAATSQAEELFQQEIDQLEQQQQANVVIIQARRPFRPRNPRWYCPCATCNSKLG